MSLKRKTLPKRLRFEILKRDGFTCAYCGARPPNIVLHVDHIEPVAEGGSDDPDNLVTSCEHCNRGKGAIPLQATADAHLRVRRMERERAMAEVADAYNAWLEEKRKRLDAAAELMADEWAMMSGRHSFLTEHGMHTVRYLLRNLVREEILDAMRIAARKFPVEWGAKWKTTGRKAREAGLIYDRRFRYFCGICHRYIREDREADNGA